jgi:hypothetical protein
MQRQSSIIATKKTDIDRYICATVKGMSSKGNRPA